MKNFFALLAISFKTNLTSTQSFSTKKKRVNEALIGLAIAIVFGYVSVLAYQMGKTFKAAGVENLLLFFAIIGGTLLTLINSIFSSFNFIFKAKDHDLLFSLPIKSGIIFTTKLLSVLLLNYIYLFPIYIPFCVVYLVLAKAQTLSIIYFILGFLFMPLFSIFLGLGIGMLFNIFSSFRLSKVFYLIFSLLFITAIMVVNSNPAKLMGYFQNNSSNIVGITSVIYYPFKLLSSAIEKGKTLKFLGFCAVSFLPIFILTLFASRYYVGLTSFYTRSRKHKKYTHKETNSSIYLVVMVKKELKRLLSSSAYLLNSCIGPIMLILFAAINMFTNVQNMIGIQSFIIAAAMVSMMTLINSPLAVSISLEGPSFWVYKSLPILPIHIINAKLLTQLIIFLPLSLIGSSLLCISFKPGLWIVGLFILFTISINIFGALLGMTIGLKKYNLHYTSEIQIIKQSSAVIITMLLGVIVSLAVILPYMLLLEKFLSVAWYLFIVIVLSNIVNGIMYKKFIKVSTFDFNEIL